MRATERTSLTRPTDSPDYVEFASFLRTRRARIRQFQCCVCAILIVIFTMALVVTISYSVNQAEGTNDTVPNLTSPEPETTANLGSTPKLGFTPRSLPYTFFSNTVSNSPSTPKVSSPITTNLTEIELQEGLQAGQQAMQNRLSADVAALANPVPLSSPEWKHRYAVMTCPNAGNLALAAVAEIAATKKIEASRSVLGQPSSIGSFFNGGWAPIGTCKEFFGSNCTIDSKYRTLDGTCNRQMHWGSSFTPFRRTLPSNYADGIEVPRKAQSGKELPSAREVSLKVHKPSASTNPSFTVMLAVFGQFLDHDISATALSQGMNGSSISCCPPSVGHPECFPVKIEAGDPAYDMEGRTCMEFVRSAPAPQCRLGPREQLNQVSAFIDGSAIYGSDLQTARDLREFSGGRLRMQRTPDNRTLLPPSTDLNDGCNRETEALKGRYCFAAGDGRANENLHLTTMHLIWARQHNKIADDLAAINPTWSDETLYQEARRIVGAQLQHITYHEFLPIVLGEKESIARGLKPLISGYRQWVDAPGVDNNPAIANSFASAAFRFAHSLLPGLIKVTDEAKGTSSYVELHKMLFNPYSLYSEGGIRTSVTSATNTVIQMTSPHVTSQLTNHLFENPLTNTTALPCGLDLVSLNIQRGRDHGLPGYTKWREYCGLGKVGSFSDLFGHLDPEALEEISMLYESVDDVDLYTGALAEIPVNGGIVGPTFNCLIGDQFDRLQKGDRYWYELGGFVHSFTPAQLQELRKTTLARIICDCSDGITQIQPEVMRSVSPYNPVIICEDLPNLSIEGWRKTAVENTLKEATFLPTYWLNFKKTINETVSDLTSLIDSMNNTTATEAEWAAFRDYINNTFADLKDQFVALHPSKPPKETLAPDDSFILRSTVGAAMYRDWLNFKMNLINTLSDTTGKAISPTGAQWIAFKQKLLDMIGELKIQTMSVKSEVIPQLQKNNIVNDVDNGSPRLMAAETVFDWMSFKNGILYSIDGVITDIAMNMPPPGDSAWAGFGDDIKNRFDGLRNKIGSQKSTEPDELLSPAENPAADWIAFKKEIIQTVNDAVQKIENAIPTSGDPAWAAYGNEIAKGFSAFKDNFANDTSRVNLASFPNAASESGKLRTPPASQLSDLTVDWTDFRDKINSSIAQVISQINGTKPPTAVDPVGWMMFGISVGNKFAELKDEIADVRSEWLMQINAMKLKNEQMALAREPREKMIFPESSFPFVLQYSTIIPPADWIAFKKEINDTIMYFVSSMKNTSKVDWVQFQNNFEKSFADLKNEITSLRDILYGNDSTIIDFNESEKQLTSKSTDSPKSIWSDWVDFRAKINSTVQDFVESLMNQTQKSNADIMKILFQTKDKFSNIEPPDTEIIPPVDWTVYFSTINKTLSGLLKDLYQKEWNAMTLKATEPMSSSSVNLLSSMFGGFLVVLLMFFNFVVPGFVLETGTWTIY